MFTRYSGFFSIFVPKLQHTMPLRLPKELPAIGLLKDEGIFIDPIASFGEKEDKPLRIAILNLMPTKITTETDLIRLLSASPLSLDVHLMKLRSHTPKNTSPEHMRAFYRFFDEMRDEPLDGFIITGAPVEHLDFEQVNYWPELCDIFSWARTHVGSTLYICWAAQAGLYYHYGIPKYPLREKMFGIFPQTPLLPKLPIFRGFDDIFFMPHSRHTEIRREDILKVNEKLKIQNSKFIIQNDELTIIAESPMSGVSMVMAREGKEIFVTGHSEYAPQTLDTEYRRDLAKGLPIKKPYNYYRDDNPELGPLDTWRAHGSLFFQNWINHYVLH